MRNSNITGILLLALLTMACQRGAFAPEASATATHQQTDPQILFVNLEILKDSASGDITVQLLNTIVANGRVKDAPSEQREAAAGDLLCSFKNQQEEVLATITVPNPLQQTLEYSTEAGAFEKNTFQLQRATFSLRTQLLPGTTTVEVQQLQPDLQLKSLSVLALSL